jgi:hypothetical protein
MEGEKSATVEADRDQTRFLQIGGSFDNRTDGHGDESLLLR